MPSYCRSRYPTISEKLRDGELTDRHVSIIRYVPRLIVNLVTKSGRVNDGERDAGTFLIEFCKKESASMPRWNSHGHDGDREATYQL
jgi:hypothetical protein